MYIWLIRHGLTRLGEEGRYQGSTDAGLSERGRAELQRCAGMFRRGNRISAFVLPDHVYVSPAKRARETAQILFPEAVQIVVEGLREMDFGAFEGRTWQEMENDAAYRAWVDGGCIAPCPGGEDRASFSRRTCAAFQKILEKEQTLRAEKALLPENKNGSWIEETPLSQTVGGDISRVQAELRLATAAQAGTEMTPLTTAARAGTEMTPPATAADGGIRLTPLLVIVAHGGTQMAVLEKWGRPQKEYYEWQTPCGSGWLLETRR